MGFGKTVVKLRHIILIVGILLLIPAAIGMKTTKINYDMLSYLPDDMETVKGQNLLLRDFHKGGFSIVVTENMKTDDMKALKEKISKIDHVESVLNLSQVLDPSIPTSMYPKAVRENIKKDNDSMIVVFFNTSTSAEPTIKAIKEMRKVCTRQCYVSGMSALVTDLQDICETEEVKYIIVAVLLSLLAMMILLDSFAAPVLFLASIGMAILYNMGTNILLGEISYITKAIAAVLQLGVTMDYSIFLWHSYEENVDAHPEGNHLEAMGDAINQTLVSVSGSSLTTIAGFLAMCFMSYKMGVDLGIVMAKGVVFGVISSVTVLPSMMLVFDKLLQKTRHRPVLPDMSALAHRLTSRYGVFLLIFVIAFIPAVYGYMHKNVVYDFTKMLSDGSKGSITVPYMTANEKLENDFGIGTTHMIIADADLDHKTGTQMSNAIKKVTGVKTVLGVDAIVQQAMPSEFIPDKLKESLVAKDSQLIMINSEYRVSTVECNNQITKINNIINKYDKGAKLIGEGPATKDLIKITDKDFRVVNWISIAAVFLIILLVLRSGLLPFLLVAAIEFAIFLNLGIPGFTHLELPFIVPVCISTIQLGSTVDYAILLSTRYKVERMAGKTKREAVDIAAATSIPSIIVSAMGFFTATIGVSLYSNVSIISTLCGLMARGAIISMLTVILVLPSLLMAFDKLICRTTIGLRVKDGVGTGIKA